jgi:diacylglycerol kinase family enzyme
MPVLPRSENVCVVDQMGVLSKIRNKKLFYEGRHGELPEVRFYSADRVDIDYSARIPLQLDGELVWLEEKDFPISLRVLDPGINVLRP